MAEAPRPPYVPVVATPRLQGHRISRSEITAVVLAGGQGSRMGGVDKGLQDFHGTPLARHALARVAPQVGAVMVSANRNLPTYEGFGVQVVSDDVPGFAGPLAGVAAALAHASTPWLLTVPCDAPYFPMDLARRLADAAAKEHAQVAVACSVDADGKRRWQPTFALIDRSLSADLEQAVHRGQRKVAEWLSAHRAVEVEFGRGSDDSRAFLNVNTLAQLRALS